MEGRAQGTSLRVAIGWVCTALLLVLALSFYKQAELNRFSQDSIETVRTKHDVVLKRFQASFYFYYEDQFLPGIRKILTEVRGLERIQILSTAAMIIFDSDAPAPSAVPPRIYIDKNDLFSRLSGGVPNVSIKGFKVQVLIPTGQYAILYTLNNTDLRNWILWALVVGFALISSVAWISAHTRFLPIVMVSLDGFRHILRKSFGLKLKFLLTIVLVNLLTGVIIFFTLSELQTRERTQEIEKESILFSRFATAQVVSDFSNYFYFNYADKFLPGINSIISTNENLIGIRIISRRTNSVLFDSEMAPSTPPTTLVQDAQKSDLPPQVEVDLRTQDQVTRQLKMSHGGETLYSVIHAYRGEGLEPLFFIEYRFSFQTLRKGVEAIRRQILLDLIPAMALGLFLATLFAQLLIAPIRRLVTAFQRVSSGDYGASVETSRSDEVGELIHAFNAMTSELRRKQELRKFLSDSTYRQIVEASENSGAPLIGGTRLRATVLFSDIRNFVSHCENLEAEEVTAMLNEYFTEMVEVVRRYGGEVDKFIGDGILAVFYAAEERQSLRQKSIDGPSPASTAMQAVFCALEMHERLREFNLKRMERQKRPIEIGVGITHGEVISGPIGSKDRMDFTIIGDVVNLASRIEKFCKLGRYAKVVFSGHVEELIKGLVDYEEIRHEGIRGKEEEVTVFELIKIRDLKTLMENVTSADFQVRCKSIELLGQSRNETAIPYVLQSLKDSEEEVRLSAVLALSKLSGQNNSAVLEALFQGLRIETAERLISALISAIGRVCTDDRILGISRFLDSPNERIVANTVEALGQVRTPKCVELILPKLTSVNNRVKANAAMALFAAGKIQVVELLKPMLMHSDPLMRSSAAFALGELTLIAEKDKLLETWRDQPAGAKLFLGELQQCVPLLVSLLKDNESMVKRQAVIALGKIKDKSAVLPIIDNIDMEKDTHEMIQDITRALQSIGSHRLVREVISRLS